MITRLGLVVLMFWLSLSSAICKAETPRPIELHAYLAMSSILASSCPSGKKLKIVQYEIAVAQGKSNLPSFSYPCTEEKAKLRKYFEKLEDLRKTADNPQLVGLLKDHYALCLLMMDMDTSLDLDDYDYRVRKKKEDLMLLDTKIRLEAGILLP